MKIRNFHFVILLCLGFARANAEDLKIEFDERGLSSINHNGMALLTPELRRFRIFQVNFSDKSKGIHEPKPKSESFDLDKKTLTQDYEGFRVECEFLPKSNRLDMKVKVTNTSADTMRECVMFPLELILPNTPKNAGKWSRNAFLCNLYEHEKGAVGVTPTAKGSGYFYIREPRSGARPLRFTSPVSERKPEHPIVDSSYWYEAGSMLKPGETGVYDFSLVFGPPGSTISDICPDAFDNFAKQNPMVLNWPDRRPIASAFLCNPATGWKTNPRGYFQNQSVDVTTEEGLQAFGESLMKYADNCIARMQQMNAQGIIVWDIEGQEMPHMISYIGDPRMLAKLSPEMDKFADAFMKKFTDAGFKTGITLRPTEVYKVEGGARWPWNHREVRDPVALMSEKIKEAQKRWGCTIFYLDSSVFSDDYLTPEQRKQKKELPWVMPKQMFEKLARLHPDCLICPEWADRDNYRFGAPYKSPNLGQGGTDSELRRIWPDAFSLVAVGPELIEKHWSDFTESVAKGDILLFMPWYSAPSNIFVELLYKEAAIRKSEKIKNRASWKTQDLAEKATSPDEATRYAVAMVLAESPNMDTARLLPQLLGDESPLVRKQALEALSKQPRLEDPATVELLMGWIKESKDPVQNALRSPTAVALAKAGDLAVPGLLEILGNPKFSSSWPYAIKALGKSGTVDSRVGDCLVAGLTNGTFKGRLRVNVIEALGFLKFRNAVPVLISILDKKDNGVEPERGAAVVALGNIRDERAVKPLIDHFKVVYRSVVTYWINNARENALRSITGEKNILGVSEWEKWYASCQRASETAPAN